MVEQPAHEPATTGPPNGTGTGTPPGGRAEPAGDARVGVAQRTVGSYDSYQEAEQAVDRLTDAGFPVERATIVGRGLQFIERVTGQVTAVSVAARSAVSGAVVGALTGWLLGIFDLTDPLVAGVWLAINGALLGAVLGAVLGLMAYAVTRGRRDFTAVAAIRAERYDLLVDAEVADRAAHLLRSASTSVGRP